MVEYMRSLHLLDAGLQVVDSKEMWWYTLSRVATVEEMVGNCRREEGGGNVGAEEWKRMCRR